MRRLGTVGGFVIRPAASTDVATIAGLETKLFPDAWREESLAPYCGAVSSGAVKGRSAWIACRGDPNGAHVPIVEPVGYLLISWVLDEGAVDRVGTAPGFRRRGIAGVLLERGVADLVSRGVRRVFLEVAASNVAAIRLYEHAGFTTISRRARYYAGPPPDDALVMEKVIG